MPLNVHIIKEYDKVFIENLKALVNKDVNINYGETIPDAPTYEILICGVPERAYIEASPRLKHLIIPWSGLPKKTRRLMLDFPHITVHNIHHNAVPVAESAFALLLALAKNLIRTDSSLRKFDWSRRYQKGNINLLSGRKVLIIGYVAVGKEIASRCLGFNMKVVAVNRKRTRDNDGNIRIYSQSKLNELLINADVLILSVPLTEKSKGMIGKRQLASLPDGAIVINISRGEIIDERALYEELKSGRIKAGLDVWYNYPENDESRTNTPPANYPFHRLPNIIMTPHLAGHSDRTEILRAEKIAELLNAVLAGQSLPN
jgi:phosphoglycerate dehydrogenase-like enzyme